MKKSNKDIPPAKLSDTELLKRIESLNQKERETTLSILMHLIELERRKLYLELGYGSLFDYCMRRLGYSRSSAGRRINAARCIRDYPEIRDLLLRGEINLCSVSLMAGILTPDNKDTLIAGIRNRSTGEVEELVSRHRPVSGHRDRVRPVYVKRVIRLTELEGCDKGDSGARPGDGEGETAASVGVRYSGIIDKPTPTIGSVKFPNPGGGDDGSNAESATKTVNCTILERRLKLDFTVSPEFMEKLERARSLLSNKHPRGLNFEKLFGILLDEYLDRPEGRIKRREMRKSGKKQGERSSVKRDHVKRRNEELRYRQMQVDRPENKRSNKPGTQDASKEEVINKELRTGKRRSRRIPQSVRDEVFARDGGQCTFVGKDGVRCEATDYLQIDHIVPYAKGGKNTAENLRLLCYKHNLLEAEKAYGKKHMERFHRKE